MTYLLPNAIVTSRMVFIIRDLPNGPNRLRNAVDQIAGNGTVNNDFGRVNDNILVITRHDQEGDLLSETETDGPDDASIFLPFGDVLEADYDNNLEKLLDLIFDAEDRVLPTGTIAINGGATHTGSAQVTLDLSAQDDKSATENLETAFSEDVRPAVPVVAQEGNKPAVRKVQSF